MTVKCIVVLFACFLFLHLCGFLLTKKEITTINPCNVYLDEYLYLSNITIYTDAVNRRNNVIPHNPKRLFFIIVDALRLDFMTLHDETQISFAPSFNRLSSIHNLINQNRSQCALFGFRADNPTTTSQRLKAITTGGLPTFVEIGANFNSGQVREDSLISAWAASAKNIVMLGDDTWTQLYPEEIFWKSHPFDSFNTRDLFTVDNGILNHLDGYLLNCSRSSARDKKQSNMSTCQWDVLIAHFLGVDHIGHTHSAHHPYMTERLEAMNAVINKAVLNLPDDVLLVVMGDHGMTDEGEHGGNTELELNSGLFLYSKSPLVSLPISGTGEALCGYKWEDSGFKVEPNHEMATSPRMVEQIDLAVTLSALLDHPTPYTSLGAIIPELFYISSEGVMHRLIALLNVATEESSGQFKDHNSEPTDTRNSAAADEKSKITYSECDLCLAAYVSDPLSFQLYQNSMQVFTVVMSYFAHNVSSVHEVLEEQRGTGKCVLPSEWNLPTLCSACMANTEHDLSDEKDCTNHPMTALNQDIQPLYGLLIDAICNHRIYLSHLMTTASQAMPSGSCNPSGVEAEVCPALRNGSMYGTQMDTLRDDVYRRYYLFLREVFGFARGKWNTFNVSRMTAGAIGLFATVVVMWMCVLSSSIVAVSGMLDPLTASQAEARTWNLLQVDCLGEIRAIVFGKVISYWRWLQWLASGGAQLLQHLNDTTRVVVGVTAACVMFNTMSSFSNSFIIEASTIHFFEVQTLTLISMSHRVACMTERLRKTSLARSCHAPSGRVEGRCNHETVLMTSEQLLYSKEVWQAAGPEIMVLIIVRCMWQLRVTNTPTIRPSFAMPWILLLQAVPYVCLLALVWAIKMKYNYVSRGTHKCKFVVEKLWIVTWSLCTVLLLLIDMSQSLCENKDRESLPLALVYGICNSSVKTKAERMVLGYSIFGVLYVVLKLTQDPLLTLQLRNLIQLSLHVMHLVLLCAKPVSLSAQLMLMLMLCAVGMYFSIHAVVRDYMKDNVKDADGTDGHSTFHIAQNRKAQLIGLIGVDVIRMLLIGKLIFFITGHHYKFSSLQLDVGFVASESFHFVQAGVMVAINTCGFDILTFLWSICTVTSIESRIFFFANANVSGMTVGGSRRIHNDHSRKGKTLQSLSTLLFVSYHSCITAGSCISVLILRHHLMLWAVFAPKVMFDAASWMIYIMVVFKWTH